MVDIIDIHCQRYIDVLVRTTKMFDIEDAA
jgi:hypothetical protein